MKVNERRIKITEMLVSSDKAITGDELAATLGVSRQIIVQDIALLKAAGYNILSTHNGYVLHKATMAERVFNVKHSPADTGNELSLIVSLGGIVVDVFVWHKMYGKLSATLNIYSKFHIDKFINNVKDGKSTELMNITNGYHSHTVRAESQEILDKIEAALAQNGYLASVNQ